MRRRRPNKKKQIFTVSEIFLEEVKELNMPLDRMIKISSKFGILALMKKVYEKIDGEYILIRLEDIEPLHLLDTKNPYQFNVTIDSGVVEEISTLTELSLKECLERSMSLLIKARTLEIYVLENNEYERLEIP